MQLNPCKAENIIFINEEFHKETTGEITMHYNASVSSGQPQPKLTEPEVCPINLTTVTDVLALYFLMKILGSLLVFP